MNEQKEQSKSLKDSLLERIESENLCPHSRLFFQSREFIVWSLWLLSVVVGALAIAVTLFVLVYNQYALYEATHENFLTFMVEALPYLWIVTFAIMVFTAVYNVRHTKHGYRYPLWMIMGSSVLLSLVGGSTLQLFGFGYELDELMGKHMMLYTSQQKFEQRLWQDPDDGRLVGMQIYTTMTPTSTIIFKDVDGESWIMDVGELSPQDIEALARERTVRLLGKPNSEGLKLFHACGVFPLIRERALSTEEMSEQRQSFLERISRHAERAKEEGVFKMRGSSFASTSLSVESKCASIAPVYRFSTSH